MTREEVQDGFKGMQILGLKDNIKAMNKSNTNSNNMTTLLQTGNIIAKYLLDRGQIREMPDLEEIIDSRFAHAILVNDTTY